jgi:hypothetical protein
MAESIDFFFFEKPLNVGKEITSIVTDYTHFVYYNNKPSKRFEGVIYIWEDEGQ